MSNQQNDTYFEQKEENKTMKKIIIRKTSDEFNNYSIEVLCGENRSVLCRVNEAEICEEHGNSLNIAEGIARACWENMLNPDEKSACPEPCI